MSLEPYLSYENRGVDWIDRYPAGWMATRLSRLLRGIKDGTHGTFARVDQGRPFLSAKNVQDWGLKIDESESQISEDDFREIVANGYPADGDVAITIVGTIGRACVYRLPSATAFQRSVCFLRPGKALAPEFLKYQVQADVFQEQLRLRTKVSAQPGVYMGDISSIGVLVPTQFEQHRIVEYLDRETEEIDAFIADQEGLIILLNERRGATITHAVTKGLDLTVPMKDSGVEWMGLIPKSWDVAKLGWYSSCNSGKLISADDVEVVDDSDHKYPVIGGNGSMGFAKSFNVSAPVLVIGRVGALCGNVHLVTDPAWVTDNALRLTVTKKYVLQYLAHLLRTRDLNLLADKTAQPLITGTLVSRQRVPLPPVETQTEIAEYLENETTEIDAAIDDARQAIKFSKERRAALISAVVTGKIDVREAISVKHQLLEGEPVGAAQRD